MLKESLLSLATVVLCGAITLIGVYVKKYLAELTVKLENETEGIKHLNTKKLVSQAIQRINNLVEKNVTSMEVTVVRDLKAKGATVETLKDVANKVKTDVLKQTSVEIKELAQLEIADLEDYVQVEIEVALARLKGQI